MDQFDIYVNVDRTSHNRGKRNHLENEGKIQEPKRRGPALSDMQTGAETVKKSSCRAAAVCLGLLCLLLLTGLIMLVFLYTKGKTEMNLLQNSYNNLTDERDQLQTGYNNLTKERDQLQTGYNNLTDERDQLQTGYNNMVKERDQLKTGYNNLAKERDQLKTGYNNLAKERDQLQTGYNNLAKERDQLKTGYNNMVKERHQLQKRFEDMTKERNDLQRKLVEGWKYFRGSFYQISSLKKTWQESRDDCLNKGADLVIINSREEQDFTRSFRKRVWIGLTDRETEGTWKWVDGTPLTTSYWADTEPNGAGRDEDCAEINTYDLQNSWNDDSCNLQKSWICEQTSPL